jgi:four helix bundle protein
MADTVIQSFRDLHAWQSATELTLLAYAVAKRYPPSERFELSTQVRRSAVSIPSNIAEGQSCAEDGRYLHHVRIAQGSLRELETEIEIGKRLGFMDDRDCHDVEQMLSRTGQLLHGLARSVQRRRLQRAGKRLSLLALSAILPLLLLALAQSLLAFFQT